MSKFNCAILFLLLVAIANTAYSQKEIEKTDISEIRKNNFQVELGFNTLRNILDNTASATILFKKKYNPGDLINVTSINFLRAYISFSTQINFQKDSILYPAWSQSNDFTNLSIGFGMEKQFQNRRFVHYIGCDLFGGYYNGIRSLGYYISSNSIYANLSGYDVTVNLGLIPFIGIKYYITDQLSLGIETGLSLSYFNSKFKDVNSTYTIVNNNPVVTYEDVTRSVASGMRFRFLGLRFLTLGYSFK